MRIFLTAALLMTTFSCLAEDRLIPIPIKDRLRIEMWHFGVSELTRSADMKHLQQASPSEVEEILNKLGL